MDAHLASSRAFRQHVRSTDVNAVREIVNSTHFFSCDEIEVAAELIEDRLARGAQSDYRFIFADLDGKPIGYACFGPIACTVGSFDLYWIAVHNDHRRSGLGRRLLEQAEESIAEEDGRRIYIETSSRPQYQPTRAFYERCGYTLEAHLPDFYAPGDSKLIYVKAISG